MADLVLLEASPLEDIQSTRRIAGVMTRGRYFDRAAQDAQLAAAERAAGAESGETEPEADRGKTRNE